MQPEQSAPRRERVGYFITFVARTSSNEKVVIGPSRLAVNSLTGAEKLIIRNLSYSVSWIYLTVK